ncbi:hypothetical protein SASPL_152503 [Salvia splendens]|uniref:Uncharacterized protein n=1 Tax=Salvia splendens TaxID=180675 RepID=A0A8X8W407_SALSN|nr:hypothetical protein SASPL_152503 [Salvia splendens]
MNLKLSGSDNISSYMAAISCLKSKALSIVLALLVKAWNRFKTAPSTSSYEYSRQHIVFGIMMMRKLKFTVLKNDMIAAAQACVNDIALKYLLRFTFSFYGLRVLAAVIMAGASREPEILAEIRDAVFSFIRKMEPRRVMDTMLVSRVRIFYIMSRLARSPELQSIKLSAGRSLVRYDSSSRNMLVGDRIQGFKVNIKPEKKSKLSSVVLKIRGIDQHVYVILYFCIDDKATINDFLSIADDTAAGATGQLELLSTAIMDAATFEVMWFVMVHILISTVILVHKDIAGTLATEAAEDFAQVAKLRSALESVDHKRRKILQQMKNDAEMLNLESGAAPIRSPSTSAEDARLVSLISLDSILKQVKVFHLSPISHLLTFWQMSQMLQLHSS